MKKVLGFIIVILLVIAIGLGLAIWNLPNTNTRTERIMIEPGSTLSSNASKWEAAGWLPSAVLLRIQARFLGLQNVLKAGEYDVPAGLNGPELLEWFTTAKPVTYRVTLVEGTRLVDALSALKAATRLTHDIEPLTPDRVAEFLDIKGNPEGWLYPDTYVYQSGEKTSSIIRQAYKRMNSQLAKAWAERDEELPYKIPYEALIMASIVEKETAVPAERPEIAGVFVRRLQKGMRLETDPTVIYGMGDKYEGNIRKRDLRNGKNPYNTYRIKGLPPTPIALAGRAALDAALNPAEGSTLFFVAKGDGSHYFSTTLKEHNKAVYQYQIKERKKNYRSTPK